MRKRLTLAMLRAALRRIPRLEAMLPEDFPGADVNTWLAYQMAVANIRRELDWRIAYAHEGARD